MTLHPDTQVWLDKRSQYVSEVDRAFRFVPAVDSGTVQPSQNNQSQNGYAAELAVNDAFAQVRTAPYRDERGPIGFPDSLGVTSDLMSGIRDNRPIDELAPMAMQATVLDSFRKSLLLEKQTRAEALLHLTQHAVGFDEKTYLVAVMEGKRVGLNL